jgi:ABC-type transport system substrate-binding protein
LFKLNTEFKLVLGLAQSWEQPSSKEWIIRIKNGVKFHDGNERTSSVVKFIFDQSKTMPKMRKAINYAIDKDAIIMVAIDGTGVKAESAHATSVSKIPSRCSNGGLSLIQYSKA